MPDPSTIPRRQTVPDGVPAKLKPLTARMVEAGLLTGSLIAGQILMPGAAFAGPQGGTVISGAGSVTQTSDLSTTILQQSQNLLMNFDSFDVGKQESVLISQPNAAAWFVGRILSDAPTSIAGSVSANGQIALINPRGVIFQDSAHIDAASLFASGLNLDPNGIFEGESTLVAEPGTQGIVVNRGVIEAATGGSVTLLGQGVENSGAIAANLGYVNLVSGREAVVSFGPEALIGVQVTKEVLDNNAGLRDAVSNSGTIDAAGGTVLLSGKVSKDLFDHAVNNSGVVRARRATRSADGVIHLFGSGGSVINTGTLDASATGTGVDGGRIDLVSDDGTKVTDSAVLAASSEEGAGGTVNVLGPTVGILESAAIDVSGAAGGGDVQIGSRAGVAGEAPATERAYVGRGVAIDADATVEGDGGRVAIEATGAVRVEGMISARGGAEGGDGGQVEIASDGALTFDGLVDTSAVAGKGGSLRLAAQNVVVDDKPTGDTSGEDFLRGTGDANAAGKVSVEALAETKGLDSLEVSATSSILIADLAQNVINLGAVGSTVTFDVSGNAAGSGDEGAVRFTMAGADDVLTTGADVVISAFDHSELANALIDIAGEIDSTAPSVPEPPGVPSPGNDIAILATEGRIRVRSTAVLDASRQEADADPGSILISATGSDGDSEAGTVLFSGVADVSSGFDTGGTIRLLGDRVGLLDEASLDASGALGGGEVLVGGNFQGNGPEANALRTYVGSRVSISADAIDEGDGGTVIVWADEITRFYGDISGRGGADGGDGGFAEVSGKENLSFRGNVTLDAKKGNTGVLLLDPASIVIRGGSGDGDDTATITSTLSTTTIAFADTFTNVVGTDTTTFDIYESEIEGTNANFVLQATNGISVTGTFTGGLTLQADNSLTLETRNASGEGSAGIDLSGGTGFSITTSGSGAITINAGTSGTDAGTANVVLSALTTSGGAITVTSEGFIDASGVTIDTSGGADMSGGDVSISATGLVTLDSVTTSGGTDSDATPDDAGAITVSGSDVTITGTLTAVGSNDVGGDAAGGVGGAVTVTATDTATPTITLQGVSIDTSGGTGTTTATGGLVQFNAAVSLTTAGTTITTGATGGGITFASTVDDTATGIHTLSLTAGTGDVAFDGAVGATPLGDVTIVSAGNVTVSGTFTASSLTETTGTGTTTLTGLVTTTDTTTGQVSLTATNIDIDGGVSAAGAVVLTGATTLSSDITTTNSDSITTGPTTIDGNVSLSTGMGAGGITFTSTVDDDTSTVSHTLALTAGTGNITFTGSVGNSTPLGAVTVNAANDVTLTTTFASAGFSQATTGGGTTTVGGLLTSTGAVTLDAATLDLNAGIATTSGGALGLVTLNASSLVDLASGQSITTTATAAGGSDSVISGAVDINVSGTGTVNLAGSIVTTGDANDSGVGSAGGAVTIDTANGTIAVADITTSGGAGTSAAGGAAGSLSINTGTSNAITLNGSTLTTAGGTGSSQGAGSTISFTDPVTLATGGVTLDTGATAGNISFVQTLNGGQSLDLTAGTGNITFTATVGNSTPLGAVTLGSAGTVNIDANLKAASLIANGGNISTFDASGVTIDTSGAADASGGDVSISATGLVTLDSVTTSGGTDSDATPDDAGAITVSGSDVTITGTLTAVGSNDVGGDAAGGVGGAVTVTATDTATPTITLQGVSIDTSGGTGTTTATGGLVQFNAAVSLTTAGTTITTGATGGGITFADALGGGQTLALTAGTGSIQVDGNVSGLGDVSIISANDVTLGDATTDTFAAQSLTQSAGSGTTTLNAAVTTNNDIAITATNIDVNSNVTTTKPTAVGTIGLTGAVSLGADLTTTKSAITLTGPTTIDGNVSLSTGTGGGGITFTSTVDDTATGSHTLDLTAGTGDIAFHGAVGGTPLGDVTIVSAGNVTLGDATTDTFAAQSLTQNTIGGTTTLNAAVTTSGAVAISAPTIDVNASLTAGTSMTLSNASAVQLAGGIVLDAQGGDLDISNGVTGITLDGTGSVTLQTTLANGNDVVLSPVSGARDLTIHSTGTVVLQGAVNLGASNNLDVTIDSDGNGVEAFDLDQLLTANDVDLSSASATGSDTISITVQPSIGGNLSIGAVQTIDLSSSVTTGGGISLHDATSVRIAGGVILDAQGGALDAATNVTGISLRGGGTVTLRTTNADSGIDLAAVSSTTTENLTIVSTDHVTLSTADLSGGDLTGTVDSDFDASSTTVMTLNGAITGVGDVVLQGGAAGADDVIDINQSITSSGALTIQYAADIRLAEGVTLTAEGGDLNLDTSVQQISLDSTGSGTVTLQTTTADNDVYLNRSGTNGVVGDGNDLVVSSMDEVSLAEVTLSGGDLSVTFDSDNDPSAAVTLLIDRAITNVTDVVIGGGVGNPSANEIIDINQGFTAAGSITLQNVADLQIAAGQSLTAANGGLDLDNGVTKLTLDGTGTGTVTLAQGGTGDLQLAPVTASAANTANLTITSQSSVSTSSIDLVGPVANGALSVTVDDNDDSVETLDLGAVTNVGAITLSGGATADDTLNLNQDIAGAGAIAIQNAVNVSLSAAVDLTAPVIDITNNVAGITLNGSSSNIFTATAGTLSLGNVSSLSSTLVIDSGASQATVASYSDGGNIQVLNSGGTDFNGAVTAGTVTLSNTASGKTVAFKGDTSLSALTTSSQPYAVSFTGANNQVTNNVSFLNSGGVTIGDSAFDVMLFNGGASSTSGDPGKFNDLAGVIRSTGDIFTFASVRLTANATLDSTNNGASGLGAAINLSNTLSGLATTESLTLNSGTAGTITVSGTVDNLGALAIAGSGGATFIDQVGQTKAPGFSIAATAGGSTIAFQGNTHLTSLSAPNGSYALAFTGTSNQIDSAVTFGNSGGVQIGSANTDDFLFDGGVDSSAGTTTLAGTARTSGDALTFGALVLGDNAVIDTIGAAISTGVITGASHTLEFNAGATGSIDINGSMDNVSLATITNSNGTVFHGTVGAANPGAITITDTTDYQSIDFLGNTHITTLLTFLEPYAIAFLGTTNTIDNAVTFNNTGGVTFGDQSSDGIQFAGGVDIATGVSTLAGGTIATTGSALTLDGLTLVDNGDVTLQSAGGAITVNGTITGTNAGAGVDQGNETLTINAGAGSVELAALYGAGGVADAAGLTSVTIVNSGALTLAQFKITGSLTQTNQATGATTFTDLVSVQSANLNGTSFDVQKGLTATGAVTVLNSGTFSVSGTGIYDGIDAAGGFSANGSVSLANDITTTGGVLSVGGNLTLADNRDVVLTTSGGALTIAGTTTGATGGAGDESLTLSAGVGHVQLGDLFGSGAIADATALTALTLSDSGSVDFNRIAITGNLTQSSAATGNTTFNGPVNVAYALLQGTNFTFSDFTASGNLGLVASGTVSQNLGSTITVDGTSDLAATDLTFTSAAAAGSITLTIGNDATLVNGLDLMLDGTIGGDLIAEAAGASAIVDSNILSVAGTSSFTADSLDLDTLQATGAVTLAITGDASVINDRALALAGTIGGNLTIDSSGNAITDAATLGVDGASSFAGSSLNLGTFQGTGNVTLAIAGASSVVNDRALGLIGSTNSLVARAAGFAITDEGVLTITDTARFTGDSLILDTVDVGGIVTLAITGSSSIDNSQGLLLEGSTGSLDATTAPGFDIGDTGILTINGPSSFVSDNVILDTLQATGTVELNIAGDTTILNNQTLRLKGATNTITATAAGGIEDADILTIAGDSTFAASDLDLGTLRSSGTVTLNIANDSLLVNNQNLTIAGSTGTLDAVAVGFEISGTLPLTISGDSAFQGSRLSLSDLRANGDVDLNVTADTQLVNDQELALSGITGSLVAVATAGAIVDSAALEIAGDASLTANGTGGAITLGTLQIGGTASISTTGAATLVNESDLLVTGDAGSVNMTVLALNGTIADDGPLTVSGTSSFDAGTLDLDTLSATGAVRLTIDNDATIVNDTDLYLRGSADTLSAQAIGADIFDSNTLTLTGASDFTSNNLTLDTLDATGVVTVTITGNAALTNNRTLLLQGDAGSLAAVTTLGAINTSGVLTIAGASAFTTTDASSSVTLDKLQADGVVTLDTRGNALIANDTTLQIQGSANSATIAVLSGDIEDSGTLRLTGTTISSFTADGLTLDTLQAAGTIDLDVGGDAILVNNQNLGLTGATGTLDATAASKIISIPSGQSLAIAGDSRFTANQLVMNGLGAAGTVTLAIDGSSQITNDQSLILAGTSGTLSAATVSGGIEDNGTLTVSGTAIFSAREPGDITAGDVTLSDSANSFGSLNLTGNTVNVNEVNDTELAAVNVQTLSVTSGGTISDSAGPTTIAVAGTATMTAAGDITLSDDENDVINFNAINFSAGAGTRAITLDEDSGTRISGLSGGALTLTAAGNIIQTATAQIDVTGAAVLNSGANNIVLGGPANRFGTLKLTGADITINETDATVLTSVKAIASVNGNGNLTIRAGGTITDSGTLSVQGVATFDAGTNEITLDTTLNNFGSIYVTGGAVTLREQSGMQLDGVSAQTLYAASGGNITDGENVTISVTGRATLSGNDITLGDDVFDTVLLGSVELTGSAVALTEADGSLLAGVTATSLAVNAAGAIAQVSGTAISVPLGAASFRAKGGSSDITLTNAPNQFGSLTLVGGNVEIVEADGSVLNATTANGDFSITSGGDITNPAGDLSVMGAAVLTASGNISVGDGSSASVITVSGDAGFAAGGTISVGSAGSVSLARVALLAGGAASLREADSTQLLAVDVASLIVESGGAITSAAGVPVVVDGAARFTANGGADNIDLSPSDNVFGSIDLTGDVVTVDETNSTVLDGVHAGTLTVTSGGGISDGTAATVEVTAQATLTAQQDIVLGDELQDSISFGLLAMTADNAEITEADGTNLTLLALSGDLTLTSGGDIVDETGAPLDVAGDALLSAGDGTASITLDESTNDFQTVDLTGATVDLHDTNGVTVTGVAASGHVELAAQDVIFEAAGINKVGSLTVTASNSIEVRSDIGPTIVDLLPTEPNGEIRLHAPLVIIGTDDDNPVSVVTAEGDIAVSGLDSQGTPTASLGTLKLAGTVLFDSTNGDPDAGGAGNGDIHLLLDNAGDAERGNIMPLAPDLANGAILEISAGLSDLYLGDVGYDADGNQAPITDLTVTSVGNQYQSEMLVSGNTIDVTGSGSLYAYGSITELKGDIILNIGGVFDLQPGYDVTAAGDVIITTGDTATFGGDVSASGTGGIALTAAGNITLEGAATAPAGPVAISSEGGNLVASGQILAGQAVEVTAYSDVTLNGQTTANSGSVTIESTTGSLQSNETISGGDTILVAKQSVSLTSSSGEAALATGTLTVAAGGQVGIDANLSADGDLRIDSFADTILQTKNTMINSGGRMLLSAETGITIAQVQAEGDITLVINTNDETLAPKFLRANDPVAPGDGDLTPDIKSVGGNIVFLAPASDVGSTDPNQNFVQRAETTNAGIFYGLNQHNYYSDDIGRSQLLQKIPENTIADLGASLTSLLQANSNILLASGVTQSIDVLAASLVDNLLVASNTAATQGETTAASSSRSTASSQRSEEEEVAEVDETAFQNLKNYDENPQGIRLPDDQQLAMDESGNIYWLASYRTRDAFRAYQSFYDGVIFRTDPVASAAYERGRNGRRAEKSSEPVTHADGRSQRFGMNDVDGTENAGL